MEVSSYRKTGSPRDCCCTHVKCVTSRNQRWCERWYFVHLTWTSNIPEECLTPVVKGCLRGTRCLISARQYRENGVSHCAVLLRLHPGEPGLGHDERRGLESALYASLTLLSSADPGHSACFVLPSSCCVEDIMMRRSFWASLAERQDLTVWGSPTLLAWFMADAHCCLTFVAGSRGEEGQWDPAEVGWRGDRMVA